MKPQVINIKDAPPGWEQDESFVYIGRAGHGHDGYFGNPFRLSAGASHGSTLICYEHWARERGAKDPVFRERVKDLANKTLVCFCAPLPCHGHILAELCVEWNTL